MSKSDKKSGFTVIEVVLVLAIAGLIFLMVFIALPSLQRQARDTQRRRDMETIIAAIKKYQSNNRGSLPDGTNRSVWTSSLSKYLPTDFKSPRGNAYSFVVRDCTGGVGNSCSNITENEIMTHPNNVYFGKSAKCDGSKIVKSANSRMVVVAHGLESGGIFCGNT